MKKEQDFLKIRLGKVEGSPIQSTWKQSIWPLYNLTVETKNTTEQATSTIKTCNYTRQCSLIKTFKAEYLFQALGRTLR